MNSARSLATNEGFAGESARRKRLGQFFTGSGLGKVLAALSVSEQVSSIVDPMAGSGDLLAACLEIGANPDTMGAIEIDPMVQAACCNRLPKAVCILGSAFERGILGRLPRREWDLVITNPPYVRYQKMTKAAGREFKLPGATEVRSGLRDALEDMSALDETDRKLFKALVSGYSGLADLAVPSWILCASMVSVGGRLALVVPEAWMSRSYASVVHYILLRWFRIEHIVEDEHAAWFDDAQIKTNLLIARRIKRRDGAFDWDETDLYTRSKVSGKAGGPEGPVARLFPGKKNSASLFSAKVWKTSDSNVGFNDDLVSISPASLKRVAENLKSLCSKQKWFSVVGESSFFRPATCAPSDHLAAWLGSANGSSLIPMESLGVSVGQGLRTGANGFFYATYISDDGNEALIVPEGVPGIDKAKVPLSCLKSVIRKQSDLSSGYAIREECLSSRVLDLRAVALPEDIEACGSDAGKFYESMPTGLIELVRKAALAEFGSPSDHKRIYELSAVTTNIRKGNVSKGILPRFWYMLPDFASRHRADLLVPRVNGGTPKAWLVASEGVLIDANFVTVNVPPKNVPDAYAVLALLNSAWCRATLECTASVLGGGALKIEAAHLRRMLVPKLEEYKWRRLSELGRILAENGSVCAAIDRLLVEALFGRKAKQNEIAALSCFAEDGRIRRSNHKKRIPNDHAI